MYFRYSTVSRVLGACLIAYMPICIADVIESFTSDITIARDGSLRIAETIIYTHPTRANLHGIYRDFPTDYRTRMGHVVKVGFTVTGASRDGTLIAYRTVQHENGSRVYIGDAERTIQPGTYTYLLEYTTTRQLGFFDTHDELYWNVTGNGWPAPIKQARALVHLPNDIPSASLEAEAYTGPFGARGKKYRASVLSDNTIVYETTEPLAPYEGLTIVASWAPGFIQRPTLTERIVTFLYDNLLILWLLGGIVLLLGYYGYAYYYIRHREDHWRRTVIPRFYPPDGFLPSMVRYVDTMRADYTGFGAELVLMAVEGYCTIAVLSEGWFNTDVYQLTPTHQKPASSHPLHTAIKKLLFADKTSPLPITQKYHAQIQRALAHTRTYVETECARYLDGHEQIRTGGVVLTMIICIIGILASFEYGTIITPALLVCCFLIPLAGDGLLKGYTKAGISIHEELEGFKLFLEAAEVPRLPYVGTPPTKTPELYERYLPYAIAFGVEGAWSKQFVPIFKQYEREGHPYQPQWYYNPHHTWRMSTSPDFSRRLSSSLSSTISSASTPPGSTSGRSGSSSSGGSSGGGGGGGGGGSW